MKKTNEMPNATIIILTTIFIIVLGFVCVVVLPDLKKMNSLDKATFYGGEIVFGGLFILIFLLAIRNIIIEVKEALMGANKTKVYISIGVVFALIIGVIFGISKYNESTAPKVSCGYEYCLVLTITDKNTGEIGTDIVSGGSKDICEKQKAEVAKSYIKNEISDIESLAVTDVTIKGKCIKSIDARR